MYVKEERKLKGDGGWEAPFIIAYTIVDCGTLVYTRVCQFILKYIHVSENCLRSIQKCPKGVAESAPGNCLGDFK